MSLQDASRALDPTGMLQAFGAEDDVRPVRGVKRVQWQVVREDDHRAAIPSGIAMLAVSLYWFLILIYGFFLPL